MSEQLLLGIDVGTSSAKAVLVAADGRVVARASRANATSSPRPGWFEQDADEVWWRGVCELVAELLPAGGSRVAAIGLSGLGPCVLAADKSGTPLRPAILYGIDSRAGAQISQLNADLGAEAILRWGGSPLTSQAAGPKVAWLRDTEPGVYQLTRMIFSASSYLVYRLTGRYVLDHHTASQFNPMYDLAGRCWNTAWAARVAPGIPLPELAWPAEVVGRVTAGAARQTGLPAGVPVTAGTVDAWAEAASAGVRHPGEVMLMYGTTMFLIRVVDRPTRHPGLWCTAGLWPGSYTLAGGMATSGAVTAWLRDLTSADYQMLLIEAGLSPAGANGLLMLPYFAGERTPLFDPDARGAILGLTLGHTRGDVYRAALEGTAFGVRHNIEAMSEATRNVPPQRVVAVGGGTQGGLWTQIVSDVTGLDQDLPAETIGASLGDALLAGVATGVALDPERWNPVARTIRAVPERKGHYDSRYHDYRQLYEVTRDISHRLAAGHPSSP